MKTSLKILGFILFWQVIIIIFNIPKYLLPSPIDVMNSYSENYELLIKHTLVTSLEMVIGLVVALLFSFIICIFMDYNKRFYDFVNPILVTSQTIPMVVLAPLFIIWFGFGLISKIVLIVMYCSYPIIIATNEGFKSITHEHINLFKLMNASKLQIYTKLKIPMVLPEIIAGLKIAATYAFSAAVISEYMGGRAGLGMYLSRALSNFDNSTVFAIIIIISTMTYLTLFILNKLESKIIKGV